MSQVQILSFRRGDCSFNENGGYTPSDAGNKSPVGRAKYGPLAQWQSHPVLTRRVQGSIPWGVTLEVNAGRFVPRNT